MPKKELPKQFMSEKGAAAPFSTVNQIGNHFHFSGTIPELDENKKLVSADLESQTREVIEKIKKALSKLGLSPKDLFEVLIVFIGKDEEYALINKIYSQFLTEEGVEEKPNRMCYGVSWIPFGALVEIKFSAVRQPDEDGFISRPAGEQ